MKTFGDQPPWRRRAGVPLVADAGSFRCSPECPAVPTMSFIPVDERFVGRTASRSRPPEAPLVVPGWYVAPVAPAREEVRLPREAMDTRRRQHLPGDQPALRCASRCDFSSSGNRVLGVLLRPHLETPTPACVTAPAPPSSPPLALAGPCTASGFQVVVLESIEVARRYDDLQA